MARELVSNELYSTPQEDEADIEAYEQARDEEQNAIFVVVMSPDDLLF